MRLVNQGLYLHCDPTASHYLKELLDAILGKSQFRNEIVWGYSGWNKTLKDHFERRHDVLFFYAKSSKAQYFKSPTRSWESKEEYVKVRKQKVRVDAKGHEYVLSDAGSGTRVKRYLADAMAYGVPLDDVWPIAKINNSDKVEGTGYPTQKPIALYERIIEASCPDDGIVLDPFAGCATTLIAAERCQRQWVGIDIWKKAHTLVVRRLQREGLADPSGDTGGKLFSAGQITCAVAPPTRTDDGQEAVPFLKTKLKVDEPKERKMSRADMVTFLLGQHGNQCQGCGRRFDDERYLELDHNTPRSDGGLNHISNRILLCGPCNKVKSNKYTLSGLRKLNVKNRWMAHSPILS